MERRSGVTIRSRAGLLHGFLAVIPLIVVVLEIATLIVGPNAEPSLIKQMEGFIGEEGAGAIRDLLDNWQRAGSRGIATGAAIITLFFAAAGAFDQLQDALNAIWGVEPKPLGGMLFRSGSGFCRFSVS